MPQNSLASLVSLPAAVTRQWVNLSLPCVPISLILYFNGLSCQLVEAQVDVNRLFGRCLVENHVAVVQAVRAALLCRDLSRPLELKIQFVAQNENWHVVWILWLRLLNEVLPPSVQILKTLRVGDVVYDAAAIGSSVECAAQTLKPFLASSVPDLKHAHSPVIELNLSVGKVSSNRRFKIIREVSFLKQMNERRLSDT